MLGGGDEVIVPLRDGVRVGQIGRRGKDHAEVIDQSPIRRLLPRRPEHRGPLSGSDAKRAGRSVNQRCASRSETILFASSAGVSPRGPTFER